MVYVRTPYYERKNDPVEQPVQFDHRHHVADDRIDCRFCHQTVETSASAGYPSTETCMACHAQVWNESQLLDTVRASYFSGTPILWERVHRLPQYVYFNHAIHVSKGIGCAECHGRIDQMPLVRQTEPLTMGWCLDCHRDPVPRLRPRDEVTNLAWTANDTPNLNRQQLAHDYDVHTRTACTTCHR
jgi:hypothetical protein